MAYVNVPKDLTKVKTKVLFNLTKRQLICFGSGALIGVPLFFLLKGSIGTSPAAMVMMVVMIPAMLFAMYEKNGQPLEVVIRNENRSKSPSQERTERIRKKNRRRTASRISVCGRTASAV